MRIASLLASVAPQWARLRLDALTVVGDQISVDLVSTARTARCPDCQRRSRRAHSHFMRVLMDLPLGATPVCVRLHARRFRCVNAACPRQTFRERLPGLAPRYQRRTPELQCALEAVSFALGGRRDDAWRNDCIWESAEQAGIRSCVSSAGRTSPVSARSLPSYVCWE